MPSATRESESARSGPPLLARAAIVIAVALAAALVAYIKLHHRWLTGETGAADFTWWWRAGHALLNGQSPYATIDPTGPYPYREGFLYPLPAAVISAPFALLRMPVSFVVFVAVSAGTLAFALTRDSYWRLPALMSMPMLACMSNGQWGPLMTAAAFSPALAWLAAIKPTLGGAAIASHLTRRTFLSVVAFLAITALIWPWWPREYVIETALRTRENYTIPALLFPGPVLIASLLRWRRPEARLLFVMAIAPQNLGWYDQLPLVLVPSTLRQMLIFGLLSYVPLFLVPLVRDPTSAEHSYVILNRMVVTACYLPCLIWVLMRPNVGRVPRWMERVATLLPKPLRGQDPDVSRSAESLVRGV